MRSMLRVVTSAALLTYAGSCLAAPSGVSTVDAAWVKAMKAGDVEAAVRCYDANALTWVTGAPLARGTKALRAAYTEYFASYTVNAVSTTEIGSETVGNTSVGWGTYALTVTPKAGGTPVSVTGRYTEVAKREGKRWVYRIDHASDDPARPSPN